MHSQNYFSCIHSKLILTEAKSGCFFMNCACSSLPHHLRKLSTSLATQCRPQSNPWLITALGLPMSSNPGRLRLLMQFSNPHVRLVRSSESKSSCKSAKTCAFCSLAMWDDERGWCHGWDVCITCVSRTQGPSNPTERWHQALLVRFFASGRVSSSAGGKRSNRLASSTCVELSSIGVTPSINFYLFPLRKSIG